MKRKRSGLRVCPRDISGHRYRGLHGKVVERVEHRFEEGLLYIDVRFADHTELSWRISARMTLEKAELADWTSGDYKPLRTFISNQRDRGI
jgi:hypothetical protein